jgi:hypothetical protein
MAKRKAWSKLMKLFLPFRAACLAALGLSLSVAPELRAQADDSARVVRLSRTEGQVLVSRPGSEGWDEAPVNFPLQEGDSLATQAGLAEIEFENGATGYLAENSVLQFTQLGFAGGGRATELALTQGAGTFYANIASQDSFRVQTSTFEVAIPERAQFRVDAFQDGAAVEVFLGRVTVSTTKGSVRLEKGQSVAVHEGDFQDLNNIARLPEQDEFDRWVSEEGEIIRSGTKNTLSYISSPNYYGLSDLSIYGNWVYLTGIGLSWRPFGAGISWTPFMNGTWIQDPRLGWIWVSNEAWGWTPYHFGSWYQSPMLGWVWVPGGPAGLRRWDPACVNWVDAGGRVGWVARSPLDKPDNGSAPANLVMGVVTRPSGSRRSSQAVNELVTGKETQSVKVLSRPPPGFESRLVNGAPRPGKSRAPGETLERQNQNEPIVFDRNAHTFINRDESGARTEKRAPVPPAAAMPRTGAGDEIPRVTIPSTMPAQSPANRVLLPPSHPTAPASPGNAGANTVRPGSSPTAGLPQSRVAPLALSPTVAPKPAQGNPGAPRPNAAAPSSTPASSTPSPRGTSGQSGTTSRPTTPAQPPSATHPKQPAQ